MNTELTDFNDMAQECGREAVRNAVINAMPAIVSMLQSDEENGIPCAGEGQEISKGDQSPENDGQMLARLAALPPLEYDRVRTSEAERLQVRITTLDDLVKARRKEKDTASEDFPEITPWAQSVDGAGLLVGLSNAIQRFVICSSDTANAAALWIVMTWFIDQVQIAPLAIITSPEKRCGKSQLLTLIGKLSRKPLTSSSISPAALFRAIELWRPTLLIDEADAFMRDNEELRCILNAGHTRDNAFVTRTVGEDHIPKRFCIWGAKALAGIGQLADTLMDRSLVLQMRRKKPNEKVERLRHAEPGLFDELRAKLARFANDNATAIANARPSLPEALGDRAQDNWEPLLAIADLAGDSWPTLARKTALHLSGAISDTPSTGSELLSDIRDVFGSENGKSLERVATADLIEALCAEEEKPWASWNRGARITPRQLAKKLREYGIASKNIRIDGEVFKGFERAQFEDVFSRYLAIPNGNAVTTLQTNGHAVLDVALTSNVAATINPSATRKAAPDKESSGIADKTAPLLRPNEAELLAAPRRPERPAIENCAEFYKERAAIMEYGGGLSREDAEAAAREATEKHRLEF